MVTNFIVITLVMVLQVVIGIYGFYAIRTFEKYTVPPTGGHHGADEHARLEPSRDRQLGTSRVRCRPAPIWRC